MDLLGRMCEYDICIVSKDRNWEELVSQELKARRPGIKCVFGSPAVQLNGVKVSRMILLDFRSIAYVHFILNEIVNERDYIPQLILVKNDEDAKVPVGCDIFTVVNFNDDNLYEKLLKRLDEPDYLYEFPSGQTGKCSSVSLYERYQILLASQPQIRSFHAGLTSSLFESGRMWEYDFYIISGDGNWEELVSQQLKAIRPGIKCVTNQYGLAFSLNEVKASRMILVGLKSMAYSDYNFNEIVNRRDYRSKLILVKINEDAKVPEGFDFFTVLNFNHYNFYGKLLKMLDKPELSVTEKRATTEISKKPPEAEVKAGKSTIPVETPATEVTEELPEKLPDELSSVEKTATVLLPETDSHGE